MKLLTPKTVFDQTVFTNSKKPIYLEISKNNNNNFFERKTFKKDAIQAIGYKPNFDHLSSFIVNILKTIL